MFAIFILQACSSPVGEQQAGLNNPTGVAFSCVKDGKILKPADCRSSGGEILGFIINEKPGDMAVLNLSRKIYTDADKFIPGYTRFKIGEIPSDIISLFDGEVIVVANRGSKDIAVVNSLTLEIERFSTPFAPARMTYAADAGGKGHLIITSPESGAVYVIAADSLKDLSVTPSMREIKTQGSPLFITAVAVEGAVDLYIGNESHRFLTHVSDFGGKEEIKYYPLFPECMDGLDNDGDLLSDRNDPDCETPSDDSESGSSTDRCLDGKDNDGDGFADSGDPQCPFDEFEYAGTFACSDGLDNDGDGFYDYIDDEGCYSKFYESETAIPPAPSGPLVATPDGRFIYIAKRASSSVAVFDLEKKKVIDVNDPENSELAGQNPLLEKLGVRDIEIPSPPSAILFIKSGEEIKAFIATDSGYVYTVEVFDGAKYLHRLKALSEKLKSYATKPVLKIGGEEVDMSVSMHPEFPSLGPPFIYPLSDGSDRHSYYGIVFNGDVRLEQSEVWNVVYEGVISGASGDTGFVLDSKGSFIDPFKDFCEGGVSAGDHLIIRFDQPLDCAGFKGSEFEFKIVEVSAGELTLAPLESGGNLPDPVCFKGSLKYEVRVSGSWAVTGSKSGFLNSNYTETPAGTDPALCLKNQEAEKNGFNGRAFTSTFKEGVSPTICPPLEDSAEVEWKTFKNMAFTFRIFPPCSYDQNFKPQPEKEIRDTTLTFTVSSGFVPSSIIITGRVSAILMNDYNQMIYAVDSTSNSLVEILPESEKINGYYY